MPRTMKVKVFMAADAGAIEDQINAWLDQLGKAVVIKTDTVVTAVAERPGEATRPCIVVTVWYEPPSD
jgi:hypothetical protein